MATTVDRPSASGTHLAESEDDLDDEGDDLDDEDSIVPAATAKAKETVAAKAKLPKKRMEPNPPEPKYSPDISVLVMFRSRFSELFDGVPDLSPQDFEEGLITTPASYNVEAFLARTLTLVLNRKKNIEPGHFGRPLEEAVSSYGAAYWGMRNPTGPLPSGRRFVNLQWEDRLEILLALVHWALTASDGVRAVLAEGYSGSRTEDDRTCPLAVSPIGMDGERRRYYLIEGQNETRFRLFQETNPRKRLVNWTSIASTAVELAAFMTKIQATDTSRNARILCERLSKAMPRLEAADLRWKRLWYRQNRKQQLEQSASYATEVDGGMYHGRTRGKKVNYNDEDYGLEDDYADGALSAITRGNGTRRSSPGTDSSTTGSAPVYTTNSGRASRRPAAGVFGAGVDPDKLASLIASNDPDPLASRGRTKRRGAQRKEEEEEEEEDVESDEDDYNAEVGDEDEDEEDEDDGVHDDEDDEDEMVKMSFPVVLKYRKPQGASVIASAE
ncbi:uncharacterized protein V1518DRAFT_374249 [Limtongia smithiae]|uniref:uncharacterized protein n=1 Tax=Limtongia smithiae TaxID=1125753 RepID=UPI0034CE3272